MAVPFSSSFNFIKYEICTEFALRPCTLCRYSETTFFSNFVDCEVTAKFKFCLEVLNINFEIKHSNIIFEIKHLIFILILLFSEAMIQNYVMAMLTSNDIFTSYKILITMFYIFVFICVDTMPPCF